MFQEFRRDFIWAHCFPAFHLANCSSSRVVNGDVVLLVGVYQSFFISCFTALVASLSTFFWRPLQSNWCAMALGKTGHFFGLLERSVSLLNVFQAKRLE